jgi:DNA polymerase III gamma/tau subunit
MKPLYEKYRPRTFDDVVGQDAAVKKLKALQQRSGGFGGRAFWISGGYGDTGSGQGKSTIAGIIAADVATLDYARLDYVAGEFRPGDIAELERKFICRPLGCEGWSVTINESHKLREDSIGALLDALERIPPYVVWLFTTTKSGAKALFDDHDDATPLV